MSYQEELHKLEISLTATGYQLCPKCSAERKNKTHKCLHVEYTEKGILYNCHHCHWNGAVWYNKFKSNKKQYVRPEKPEVLDNKEKLYTYFKKRGISKETVDKYNVQINPKNTIIFPYYKDGELVNHKYRWTKKDGKKGFMQDKEAEQVFYGMDMITDFSKCVIVEGEIDVLSLAEIGIESISVPQGAAEVKLDCIENCYDWLQKFESFIIAVDNDEAGEKLKNTLLFRLPKEKCRIAKYEIDGNDGDISFKDANEVLTQCDYAKDFLNIVMETAEYVPLDNIYTYQSCYSEIFDFKINGYESGLSTGWESINKIFTIKTGHVMVVTGVPSHGKSFVVDSMLNNLSELHGWKHLKWDDESDIPTHFSQITEMKLRKKFTYFTNEEMKLCFNSYNDSFYFINNEVIRDYKSIMELTEQAVRRYGIKTLTIDPYSKLQHDNSVNETEFIRQFLSDLSSLAKRLNILIIVVAHPAKPDFKNKDKILGGYDISASSQWYNCTDYGLTVYRDYNKETHKMENINQVKVWKVKYKHMGDPAGGMGYLKWENFKLIDTIYEKTRYKTSNIEF